MKRTRGVILSLGLLAQACSTAAEAEPSGAPSFVPVTTPGDTSPADPSPPPSAPSPTTAQIITNVGESWTDLEAFPKGGHILDGVAGDGGWVVAGLCTASIDCTDGAIAGALSSEDGRDWSEASVEDPGDTSWIDRVAWNGRYIAVGSQYRLGGTGSWIVTWGSDDGRQWDLLGRLDLADCGEAGNCSAGAVGLTASGAILVKVEAINSSEMEGLWRSDDGAQWEPLRAEAFGRSDVRWSAMDITIFRDQVVLVGVPCEQCPVHGWITTDGRTWNDAGPLGGMPMGEVSLVASPTRIVATLWGCTGDRCGSEIWTSSDGSSWTLASNDLELEGPRSAFTGTTFVVAGTDESGRFSIIRSVDGLIWSVVVPDLRLDEDCSIEWLAGRAGEVLLGDPDCDIWRSTDH